ncbi:Cation Diffusion Facilitator (CDF) Family [Achlya hypogyna]|uniref:Cation Diffusion Facilitator (CDF) Family n=1 Tax=Achlya hypogyna TaxID=1202772 RepID=A0A1V9YAF0_ACHHY|nr:Cation Diffusion Facilitator (CDF) Family [Achlya hypogyna]
MLSVRRGVQRLRPSLGLRAHSHVSHDLQNGDDALKITRVGMYVNIAMAGCKGIVGTAVNSSALVADAAHSLSDLLSDFVTLWSVKVARLPPDDNHPYGYGKFEAVGSLTVGAILTAAGVSMGWEAVQTLHEAGVILAGSPVTWEAAQAVQEALVAAEHTSHLDDIVDLSFLTNLDARTQWGIAAGAALASIAAKEALYHATVRIGKQANSKVLIANAWHHRSDAISSVIALGGICGTLAGVPLVDPLAGAIVSCMIAKTGVDICLDSVRELTDKSVEDDILKLLKVTAGASSNVEDVVSVSNVRARRMGPYTMVDLRANVHPRTSVSAAQQVAARVKAEILRQLPDVSEVLVHIDVAHNERDGANWGSVTPAETLRPYREIKRDVLHAVRKLPEVQGITHVNAHWVQRDDVTFASGATGSGFGTFLDVAIVVSPDLAVRDVHKIARRARREIESITYVVEADIHLELYDAETTIDDGQAAVKEPPSFRACEQPLPY